MIAKTILSADSYFEFKMITHSMETEQQDSLYNIASGIVKGGTMFVFEVNDK